MSDEIRYSGTVKWFNVAKGFGFITTDAIDDDIFVHYQNTPKCQKVGTRRLLEGQKVSFELAINGNKGFEALKVALEQDWVYDNVKPVGSTNTVASIAANKAKNAAIDAASTDVEAA